MGKKKLRLTRTKLPKFDKGFFPNKDFDDVPDGGSSDCKHVLWERSALRKMYGMDRINSSQASATAGSGIYYLDLNGVTERVAVFGSKFYEDVSGTWTDRTGAVTITSGNLVQFISHQLNANKYLIGVNGVDAPFKWTGAGNLAALGGSPPVFSSIAKYHEAVFGSNKELLYFSDTGDPETWNTSKWVINFDRDITCQLDHGKKLAVMMADHIGSVQGYSYLDYESEENEIRKFGCVGRLAATNATFQNKTDVIATLSSNGLWVVDQAFGYEKIFGDDYIEEFNASNLSKATLAFSKTDNLLFIAAPYGASTENNYLIVVDMQTGAFWPCPDIHTNYIKAMASMKDDSGDEFVYFVDNNGYAYKFNRETKNYHTGSATEAIDARFKTKKFDMEDVHDFRDIEMLADADGDHNVNVSLGFGLSSGDGNQGSINLIDEGDQLGTTFVLGASTLGGSDYVFKTLEGISGFGRFFTLTFENGELDQEFNIRKVEILTKRRRMGTSDK